MRAVAARAALLAAMVGLAGCGGHHGAAKRPVPPDTTVAAPQPANLDTGASLRFAGGAAPANWNPLSAQAGAEAAVIAGQVLPSAFVVQPDFSLALNRSLLLSATLTGTSPPTVIYRINPKATWSDGVPITWRDFEYNWQAQSGQPGFSDTGGKPFTPKTTLGYSDITSVSSTNGDPHVVTVVFSSFYPDWKTLFADMVPAHIATKVGFDTGFTDPVDDLISGGPFLVQAYQPGRYLTLVRNARWWAQPASLSEVTFYFVHNPSEALTALAHGEVGAASLPATAQMVSAVKAISGDKAAVAPGGTWEELEFNQQNKWLADPALRQAIMLSIDRPNLIAATVGSYAPKTVPLDNRVFLPGNPAYTDGSGGRYKHANVAQAVSLLSQAGYTLSHGTLTKNGEAVTLDISAAHSPLHDAEEAFIAKALSAIGIGVSTVAGPPELTPAPNYDLAIVDRVASPALESVDTQIGDPATVGTANYSQADNRTVDSLLARASATTNPATRARLYDQADAALWKAAESLPLFQVPTLLGYQAKYVGIVNNPGPDGVTWNLASWGVASRS